jgi:hypothetical protein
MNDEDKIPTGRLRFVPRFDGARVVRILQQEFVANTGFAVAGPGREFWLDVPLIDEETGQPTTLDAFAERHR